MFTFIKKIYVFLFIPISLFIFFFRNIYLIKFIKLNVDNFGQLVQGSLIILGKKKPNEIYIFFKNQNIICNYFYFNKLKKNCIVFNYYIAKPIYICFQNLSKISNIFKEHIYNDGYDRDLDQELKKQNIIKFSLRERQIGNNFFKKFNIKKRDKIVCLNIRDNSFKKIIHSNNNWDYHNYRNFKISTFYGAINYLIKLGYFVILMGRKNNLKIKVKNKNLIDYANLKIQKKDLLDFYIVSKSEFVITTVTGFDAIPKLFNKKILQITTPLYHAETYYKNSLILTRRIKDVKKNKFLSLKETLALNKYENGCHIYPERYFQKEFKIENLNKIVLLKTIDQLINSNLNKFSINNIEDDFWKIFNHHINLIPLYHKKLKAKFSHAFLLKYKNWLN